MGPPRAPQDKEDGPNGFFWHPPPPPDAKTVRQEQGAGPSVGPGARLAGLAATQGSMVTLSMAFVRTCSSSFLIGLRSIVGRGGQDQQPPALLMPSGKAGGVGAGRWSL